MQGTARTAPGTGASLRVVDRTDAAGAREAIHRARAAQPDWGRRPLRQRVEMIARLGPLMLERADALVEVISAEVGRPRAESLAFEVMPSVIGHRWYCRNAAAHLSERSLGIGHPAFINKRNTVERVPWGVVGILAPWNYPLGIPMHEIVPALIAGNAVVFKTADETVGVGAAIGELMDEIGLPDGVFQHIHLDGPEAGDAMLAPDGVDKLFFTGSVRVGKQLMAKAAATLTPVSLELGGNDPMIVCADADLERAVHGAVWAGMMNCGQSCAGVERIYVVPEVYEAFMDKLGERVASLRVGTADQGHDVDVGPLCTLRQADSVRQHMEEAMAQGAQVYASAPIPETDPEPRFIAPTVLIGVDHSMRIMREETFGPIVTVMQVRDEDEAVLLANDSELGLSASVWTRDRRRGRELASRLQAGVITVNDHVLSHGIPSTPWGGFKQSGMGRGHGPYAFEAVSQPRARVEERFGFLRRNAWWFPYDQYTYDGLAGILNFMHGRGLKARLRGLWRFLKLVPRMLKP